MPALALVAFSRVNDWFLAAGHSLSTRVDSTRGEAVRASGLKTSFQLQHDHANSAIKTNQRGAGSIVGCLLSIDRVRQTARCLS